jgi:hypothetical protein
MRANRWVFGVAGAALAAVVATNLFDLGSDHLGIQLLNANSELSWSHRADTVVLALAAIVAVAGAYRAERRQGEWWTVAVILGLLFLDEATSEHARIDQLSFGKALYAPILLVLVICVWRLVAGTDQRVVVGAGLASLFVSFGMHLVGMRVLHPLGHFSWPFQAGVGIKEGTELAGLLLVVPALGLVAIRQRRSGMMPVWRRKRSSSSQPVTTRIAWRRRSPP